MDDANRGRAPGPDAAEDPPEVEVVIEIPRGSFLKRGSTGHVDFISPLPCPFNYGSVPQYLGLEGDLLDAVVLGPRLPLGTHMRVKAWGAVILTDRGMTDDKLICSHQPVTRVSAAWCCASSTSMRSARDCSIFGDAARGAMPAMAGATLEQRSLARDRATLRGRGRGSSSDPGSSRPAGPRGTPRPGSALGAT